MPSKSQRPWYHMWFLVLVLGALAVLLIRTTKTSQAYVTKITETTLDDFASGEFHRTGLLDIPEEGIDSIQLIPIGLVGTWVQDAQSLPIALTEHSAVAAGGYVVVMGGTDVNFDSHDEVYVSHIGAGGALEPWVEQTNALPVALSGAAAVVSPKSANESWIYVIGGVSGSGAALDTIYYTTFHHDSGVVDPWLTSSHPLSLPTRYLGAAVHNGYIYVVGGYQEDWPTVGPTAEVYYAQIQANGDLGAWQQGPSLPGPRYNTLVVAYGVNDVNTLYVMGGRSSSVVGNHDVYFADIDPADGSLTPWSTSQGDMILPIYAHSGVLVSDQIVVTGGRFRNQSGQSVITGTVQAALVDPTNGDYRLYDWCQGNPNCTIGAWLTGRQLPDIRAFHQTVQESLYIYTLGGVFEVGQPTASVYRGSMTDRALARYAPSGYYLSSDFNFGSAADLRKLEWGTTIDFPLSQTLELSYRYKRQGHFWTDWSVPTPSVSGTNALVISPPITNVILFQYRISMSTPSEISTNSPLFNWINIYYEVNDPDLSVRKDSGSVISVPVGSVLTYTIHYSNTGQWVAENAVLTETLPDHTTYAGDATWQQVGSTNRYVTNIGNVPSGASGEITFRVRVDRHVPPGVTSITNAVEINYPTMYDELGEPASDPDLSDNYAEFSNPLLLVSVGIAKEADPPGGSLVTPGQRITYTLTYSNTGDAPLTNVEISDVVPFSTTYVPGSIFGTGANAGDPTLLRWTIPSLDIGQWGTAGFTVLVSHVPDGTRLCNQAHVRTAEVNPESSKTICHTVTVPELRLSKQANPEGGRFVSPHQPITYTLVLTNNSDFYVQDVVVTDVVPSLLNYMPASIWGPGADDGNAPTLRWDIGAMDPHAAVTLRFQARVRDDAPFGAVITNQAQVNSLPTELEVSNPVTHSVQLASLVLNKNATPTPGDIVFTRQRITYTLSYFNNSEAPISGIVLTDVVPAGTTYVPGSISSGGNDSDPSRLVWSIGDLPAQAGGTVRFAVTVDQVVSGTVIENTGQGYSSASGPVASNPVTHTVHALHLILSKEATPTSGQLVGPGDQIAYTISYRNPAPVPADHVVLSDTLASIVQYVPGSIWPSATGDDSDPAALHWTIGTVSPGGSGSVGFAVTVNDPVGGGMAIVNQARSQGDGLVASASNAVVHTTDIGPAPDFVILDMSTDPAEPEAGEPFNLHVTVKNQGRVDADNGNFYVEAYLRPKPASPPSGPSDHFQGYCEDSSCTVLRGNHVEYQTGLSAGAQFPFLFQNLVLPSVHRYLLCVQVDLCFSGHCQHPDWGWYAEEQETNNIQCISVGPYGVYMPLLSRNY